MIFKNECDLKNLRQENWKITGVGCMSGTCDTNVFTTVFRLNLRVFMDFIQTLIVLLGRTDD
jgi:hypothetical protein